MWWKKNISAKTDQAERNMESIVDSTIFMSTILEPENLMKAMDPEIEDVGEVNNYRLMASFAKFNQVVEEYTKLMSSESPYITKFFMKRGFKNVFHLYHWLRKITERLEEQKEKRILFSKHIQLLWSNVGDHFATVVECKFWKDSSNVISLKTEIHKSDQEFVCSLFYLICNEIFQQGDIITFYLQHSKFFLE